MKLQITQEGEEFNFEIDEVDGKFMWTLWDGDKIEVESSKDFASEIEAQKDCLRYVNNYFDEREAANEERAGVWEWKTSRL